ncbi:MULTISPECIES: nuclear transport factor 2 family protein [Olivibacter]|uniref:Nuclear transport factor 2 family protein n=1 Tax=Olivibacter jilunii TaxID=985016 RepID=A0ABW6BBV1_9SPHI|nr:nuclear transport factor 2 family protein [Olivibacter sp. 47]MDM8174126.1 nuclear transport factor 2 family protein [Olivibacter sp. 47]MDX3917238.1 nuclear transport factor 2 family protein [Pseudosphingobacterium sp.]
MKTTIQGLIFLFISMQTFAQSSAIEQEVINLSKEKWQWMADKNVDKLKDLFDDKSVFVHMGGSWGKERELQVIESGGIHYKKADIHDVSVEIIDNTAILLNRITLLAVVGGNEVTNPFIVTEVYVKKNDKWRMGSLSFTKTMTPPPARK